MVSDLEKQYILNCINNSGIWLAGHGIWTRDLPTKSRALPLTHLAQLISFLSETWSNYFDFPNKS